MILPPIRWTTIAAVWTAYCHACLIVCRSRFPFLTAYLSDINNLYGEMLHYEAMDRLSMVLLWSYSIGVLVVFYAATRFYAPSLSTLFSLEHKPSAYVAIGAIGLAWLLLILAYYVKHADLGHYRWRIALVGFLTTYPFLLLLSGGAPLVVLLLLFLSIGYITVYADWRLAWLMLLFVSINIFLLEIWLPGEIILGPWRHDIFFAVFGGLMVLMTIFSSIVGRNYREAIVLLAYAKRRNDDFLIIASHEFKTPLTSMKAYMSILQQQCKHLADSSSLTYVAKVNDQLNHLIGLVQDMIEVSKIQSGHAPIRLERIGIDGLVLHAIQETRSLHVHRHILLEGRAYSPVFGDRTRLRQVLLNLLSNAVKYSPEDSSVLVRVVEARDKIVISVIDDGIGIARLDQAHIFEPYFRSTASQRDTIPGGLGMGLYICTEIIKAHRGRLWVESELGQGSVFSFMLPLSGGKGLTL
jgi:signal transduction histidine kinase